MSLPDTARLLTVTCEPALTDASLFTKLMDALFQHLQSEGRVDAWVAGCEAGGHILQVAYVPAYGAACGIEGGDISGCSKDKINRVYAALEETAAVQILAAPPMVLEVDGKAVCCSRKELRQLIAEERVNGESFAWNTRCASLGEWRSSGYTQAHNFWMGQVIGI